MKRGLFLIIIILLGLFSARVWYTSQLGPVLPGDDSKKDFIVPKGAGFSQIASKLKNEQLIKSETAFKLYVRQNNLASKIQPGTFELSASMPVEDVARVITSNPREVWVTLLEGWRIEEMAQKLNEQLGINQAEFLKVAKEGYMFPDTYLFAKEVQASQVANILRSTFDKKFNQEIRSQIRAQGLTEDQGVILASIVEREARSDKARTEVASILLKRFKINMGLNADATIQYALVKPGSKSPPADGWWKRHLTRDDLRINSLYNTYLHAGLPPTPICNPSLSSLKAVANADTNTPYLYYYHDSQGRSHYGRTLDEHNKNIADNP